MRLVPVLMHRWITERTTKSHRRTLAKTLLYRVIMLVTTIAVAYGFTREAALSAKTGIGTNILKTVIYYSYERVWAHIEWGLDT